MDGFGKSHKKYPLFCHPRNWQESKNQDITYFKKNYLDFYFLKRKSIAKFYSNCD